MSGVEEREETDEVCKTASGASGRCACGWACA